MDPKKFARLVAEADQAGKLMADSMPPQLWAFYKSLVLQGFTQDQALDLTRTMLEGIFGVAVAQAKGK